LERPLGRARRRWVDNIKIDLRETEWAVMDWIDLALESTIRKVQENQMGLKLSGTLQLLIYADDVNVPGNYTGTIQKNTDSLIDASKEVGLEVNAKKSKYTYMLLSRHQNAGQNHGIKIAN
jgi:hypothetical protein